jgi:hypothetical protein
MNHIYGDLDWPELKIIDIYVHRLRRKIRAAIGESIYIRNLRGQGFCLDDPEYPARESLSIRSDIVFDPVSTDIPPDCRQVRRFGRHLSLGSATLL